MVFQNAAEGGRGPRADLQGQFPRIEPQLRSRLRLRSARRTFAGLAETGHRVQKVPLMPAVRIVPKVTYWVIVEGSTW